MAYPVALILEEKAVRVVINQYFFNQGCKIMKALPLCMRTIALAGLCLISGVTQADTLQKISESGAITLGYRESSIPFSYLAEPGKPSGFGVDVANKVVEAVRKKTGKKDIKIVFQAVTSQNRLPLVANGTVDLECGSTTNNATRAKEVSFAINYFFAESRLLVKKSSQIKRLGDLTNKTVATTTGTTSFTQLRKLSLEKNLNLSVVPAKDHADGFLLLESGRAQAFVMDDVLLAGLVMNAKNPAEYEIVGEPLQTEAYACVLRKDDASFKALVDETLIGLMKSGEFEKLYKKWFESAIPPNGKNLALPMSQRLKENLKSPSDQPAS